jgi:NNP family nitrate/nitrite transporter-like MFS transporter
MNKPNGEGRRVIAGSTLAFTVLFAVWVIFGIIGVAFKKEFGLTDPDFFTLTSIPILVGSLTRLPLGMLASRYGGRLMMTLLLAACAVPLFLLIFAQNYGQLLVLAALIGLSGASFAVGTSWIVFWVPPERQGLALGTFGAGNAGASITKLAAPLLIALPATGILFMPAGWRLVPVLFALLALATAAFVWFSTPRDRVDSQPRTLGQWLKPLAIPQVWRFGLYYMVFFGAYVALSVTLPKFYVEVYHLNLATAGLFTALFIFPASLLRPLGGWLSDRFGPRLVTVAALAVVLASCACLAFPAFNVAGFVLLTLVLGVGMGVGKASTYKLVAQYYAQEMGVVGGLVGLLGGLGGWLLQVLFGATSASYLPMPFVLLGFGTLTAAALFVVNAVSRVRRDRLAPGAVPAAAKSS